MPLPPEWSRSVTSGRGPGWCSTYIVCETNPSFGVHRGTSRRAQGWHPSEPFGQIDLRVRRPCPDMPHVRRRLQPPASIPTVAAASNGGMTHILFIYTCAPSHIEIIYERCYLDALGSVWPSVRPSDWQ